MKTILVVDDEASVRQTIRSFLLKEGYDVVVASDGIEGLRAILGQAPDLVISDFDMPRMNGLELLRQIRSDPGIAMTPFILVTRVQEPGLIQDSLARGADNYLPKPFECEALRHVVQATLERAMTMQVAVEVRLDQLRRRLLGVLSHEFLTPLNGIIGVAELMKDAELTRSEINVYSDILQDSGRRLHRLCENFLLCAQLEMAALDPSQPRIRSSRTSHGDSPVLQRSLATLARQSKRSPDFRLELRAVEMRISEEYLCKLLFELTDNAFKFSKPGVPVSVSCSLVGNMAEWTVEDAGVGLSADQACNLGLFRQAARDTQEQQGVGLGIAIVRNLLALHGGTLAFRPREGGGTVATLLLPLARETQPLASIPTKP